MSSTITVEFDSADYTQAKHELLGDYFYEKVDSGEMTLLQALLAQKKATQAAERAKLAHANGECVEANDEDFFERLKQTIEQH